MTRLRRPTSRLSPWAQIYFPLLLAWQLVRFNESSLLVNQGWGDVSRWLASPISIPHPYHTRTRNDLEQPETNQGQNRLLR